MEQDLASLVAQTFAILQPYLTIIATGAAKKIGESIPEGIGNLWKSIKTKFEKKEVTREALEDFTNNPEDPDLQASFRVQLKKLLIEDEDFRHSLTDLVVNLNIQTNVKNEGSGAVAIDSSTALGGQAQQVNAPVHGDLLGSGAQKNTTHFHIAVKDDVENGSSLKLVFD